MSAIVTAEVPPAADAGRRGAAAPAATEPPVELTIDELAAETKVPSRTIRFYQASGILDKPRREGRKAVYSLAHVRRLGLIARLRDRGLRIRGMRQLLNRPDADQAVDAWLGLSDKLSEPWGTDKARVVSEAEMARILGEHPDGTLADLLAVELVEKREVGSYYLPSPGLLEVALALREAGISLDTLHAVADILRDGMREAARQIVEHFLHCGELSGVDERDRAAALDALRLHGPGAVSLLFQHEVERTIAEILEAGSLEGMRRKRR